MASFAFRVNETGTENIGARRLHTIMERVLDEISFPRCSPWLSFASSRTPRPGGLAHIASDTLSSSA
jgi:hypothetical protein